MKSFLRIVTAGVAFIPFLTTAAGAQMHAPAPPMTAQQFSSAFSGQPVELALRVDDLKRTALRGELLELKSQGVYKRTGKHVSLFFADGTPVVMGTGGDIKSGAVLFISGVATKRDNADVKKVIVATGYVRVQ